MNDLNNRKHPCVMVCVTQQESCLRLIEAGARIAFSAGFNKFAGTFLFLFVVISCLGTLNGLMLGCSRGLYSITSRGRGPSPQVFGHLDKHTNMSSNSGTFALLLCAAWLVFFYCSQMSSFKDKLGMFAFDPTELPIVTIYPFYIPIFIKMMADKNFKGFQRYVAPVLAILGSIFMVIAAFQAHGKMIPGYLIIFAIIMVIGLGCMKRKKI